METDELAPMAVLGRARAGSTMEKTLAGMYLLYGIAGTPIDYDAAYELLLQAASEGGSRARCHLGVMVGRGLGTEADLARSLLLLEQAEAAGEQDAAVHRAQLHLMHALAGFDGLAQRGHFSGDERGIGAVATLKGVEADLGFSSER